MSWLCQEDPDLSDTLAAAGIEVLWRPALSEASGEQTLAMWEQAATEGVDILCVEGAIPRGPGGSGRFHRFAGATMLDWIERLAPKARHVVAVGSCAAFGGITSGGGNPSDAAGLQYLVEEAGGILGGDFRSRAGLPVVNVAGCPTHPEWVSQTLALLAAGNLTLDDLDPLNRPRFYADVLAHHGCPRNEYYEYKASAEFAGQLGCLMEHLGCVGTQAHADCNVRGWNGGNSCIDAGTPCIHCTAPGFEAPGHPFMQTPKIAGIPVGLPTDMPKAWFVALASLAKSATPARLRNNARKDRVVTPPSVKSTRRR